MCGVEFCSMRIDQDARDVADGEMESIEDDTDVADSPAAEANRPPVGHHDAGDIAEEIEGVDLSREYPSADDD
jgi:phosphomethylpyrimidine synthase